MLPGVWTRVAYNQIRASGFPLQTPPTTNGVGLANGYIALSGHWGVLETPALIPLITHELDVEVLAAEFDCEMFFELETKEQPFYPISSSFLPPYPAIQEMTCACLNWKHICHVWQGGKVWEERETPLFPFTCHSQIVD